MELTRYLNQTATLRSFTSRDDWGNPVYASARTIRARKTSKTKWLKTAKEFAPVLVTQYLTDVHLKLGDEIDGDEISAIEEIIDFDGSYIGCKAFPRPPQGFTP